MASLSHEQRRELREAIDRERRRRAAAAARSRPKPTTQTPSPSAAVTRDEKIMEARALRARGWSAPEIGRLLGVPESTVRNWWNGGTCACGRPVDGSNRRGSERCVDCSRAKQAAERYWTHETVIDAIQRFAVENGRPPKATDWQRVNPEKGYPPSARVYGHGCPFPTWADAIEAAGFPRPRRGHYPRTAEVRRRLSEAQRARYAREKGAA